MSEPSRQSVQAERDQGPGEIPRPGEPIEHVGWARGGATMDAREDQGRCKEGGLSSRNFGNFRTEKTSEKDDTQSKEIQDHGGKAQDPQQEAQANQGKDKAATRRHQEAPVRCSVAPKRVDQHPDRERE
jgi:hypothetical protein